MRVQNFIERLIKEEDAALDQWITVLVLAILAIVIFVALKDPIGNMLNNAVTRVGTETNALFDSENAIGLD